MGLPGTGKSTVAQALSRTLDWPTIDKDTFKSTLLSSGMADEDANPLAYQLMYALARDLLREQALSVILDSPDPLLSILQDIVHETGATLKIARCLAEREVAYLTLAQRNRKLSQLGTVVSKTPGDG